MKAAPEKRVERSSLLGEDMAHGPPGTWDVAAGTERREGRDGGWCATPVGVLLSLDCGISEHHHGWCPVSAHRTTPHGHPRAPCSLQPICLALTACREGQPEW